MILSAIAAKFLPYIIGLIALIGGALGLYAKGRGDQNAKGKAKADAKYIKDRKAADHADLGDGANDGERIIRLHEFADK